MPVLPLFEGHPQGGEGVLPAAYPNAFLAEEQRSLAEKCRALQAAFPSDSSIVTAAPSSTRPAMSALASGSPMAVWIRRRSGRAPYAGS